MTGRQERPACAEEQDRPRGEGDGGSPAGADGHDRDRGARPGRGAALGSGSSPGTGEHDRARGAGPAGSALSWLRRRLGAVFGNPPDAERHDRTPVGWFARAVRVPGRERRILVQSAKATLAATAAWLLATLVLRLPQPFLAPYAAVFLVEATVYRSLRGWIQQVGSVATGVLLAALAGQLIPAQAVALAVVVFVGLLAGSWRRFGDSGVWVGVTGMLLVPYGTARDLALMGDRPLET